MKLLVMNLTRQVPGAWGRSPHAAAKRQHSGALPLKTRTTQPGKGGAAAKRQQRRPRGEGEEHSGDGPPPPQPKAVCLGEGGEPAQRSEAERYDHRRERSERPPGGAGTLPPGR